MENKYREGQFVWRELMTSDAQKARGFYGELLGWSFQDMPMPNGVYTIISKGETRVGGLMDMPPGSAFPPNWLSYVSVKDVDAVLAATKARGGQQIMVEDIPGVGRIGVLLDPQGAALGLMRAATGDDPSAGMPGTGSFCWETLNAKDPEAAKKFYAEVIGWTLGSSPSNEERVFNAGDTMVADVETAPPNVPAHWLVHVVVDKLEDARSRAEKLGGKVLMAEIKVPSVGRMAVIADPLGAAISLFEPAPPAAA